MKFIDKNIEKLDAFQRRHRPIAFTYAVIKKYGEDEAGYKAALFTYYAFLSLFPLLLILVTVTQYLSHSHPQLQADIIKGATDYFPVLGTQLADHVNTLQKSGPALIIGLLFVVYGARGVADALKLGIQQIWGIPKAKRPGFPRSNLDSIKIIVIGGLGFLAAAISAGMVASVGRGLGFTVLATLLNFSILFLLFTFLINACLPNHVTIRQIRLGGITAAVGLVLLQSIGGYVLARELKNLDALYSYFALSLGLLFWIYLQAQILFYAVEVALVSDKKEWPRSLSGKNPTPSDLRATERHKTAL